jgi:hypothetical protein
MRVNHMGFDDLKGLPQFVQRSLLEYFPCFLPLFVKDEDLMTITKKVQQDYAVYEKKKNKVHIYKLYA